VAQPGQNFAFCGVGLLQLPVEGRKLHAFVPGHTAAHEDKGHRKHQQQKQKAQQKHLRRIGIGQIGEGAFFFGNHIFGKNLCKLRFRKAAQRLAHDGKKQRILILCHREGNLLKKSRLGIKVQAVVFRDGKIIIELIGVEKGAVRPARADSLQAVFDRIVQPVFKSGVGVALLHGVRGVIPVRHRNHLARRIRIHLQYLRIQQRQGQPVIQCISPVVVIGKRRKHLCLSFVL